MTASLALSGLASPRVISSNVLQRWRKNDMGSMAAVEMHFQSFLWDRVCSFAARNTVRWQSPHAMPHLSNQESTAPWKLQGNKWALPGLSTQHRWPNGQLLLQRSLVGWLRPCQARTDVWGSPCSILFPSFPFTSQVLSPERSIFKTSLRIVTSFYFHLCPNPVTLFLTKWQSDMMSWSLVSTHSRSSCFCKLSAASQCLENEVWISIMSIQSFWPDSNPSLQASIPSDWPSVPRTWNDNPGIISSFVFLFPPEATEHW